MNTAKQQKGEKQIEQKINVDNRKCRRCSYCVQHCPAKAIKLEKGTIRIISNRCILCGSCITACPQQAISLSNGLSAVKQALSAGVKTIACLDPAFPAVFDVKDPLRLVNVLKKLGFTEVWEGAFGVELVSQAYKKEISGKDYYFCSKQCSEKYTVEKNN